MCRTLDVSSRRSLNVRFVPIVLDLVKAINKTLAYHNFKLYILANIILSTFDIFNNY